MIFLLVCGAFVVVVFLYGTSSTPTSGNVTNVYENCNNSDTNIINNNYYNVSLGPVVEKNYPLSVEELKFFVQKRPGEL